MVDSMTNNYTTGTGTGDMANTVSNNWATNCCGFRLPCGYCKELGRVCPMQGSVGVTWRQNEVTCSSESGKPFEVKL